MTTKNQTPTEILNRLVLLFGNDFTIPENSRHASVGEIQKYIDFFIHDIDALRERYAILLGDAEKARQAAVYDPSYREAVVRLARCKARIDANIAYGKELKKLSATKEGGQAAPNK
jgi:hypothetical protein